MKQQQRMAIMKDLIKKIMSKGSMDARNRWRVAEILAKDCEKSTDPHRMGGTPWIHGMNGWNT